MEIIKVTDLNIKYQDYDVIKDLSFSVVKGDYIGILGPNGAGKTTLIKSLIGLVEKTKGNITINTNKIGYLQQKVSIGDAKFPASVYEIIRSGLLINKKFPRIFFNFDNTKVDDMIKLLGLEDIKNKLIGKLSGGQLQKVLLARALVSEPDILFLDEPTTALDPLSRDNFFNIIKNYNEEKKTTVLFVTHDIGTIGKYAKKMLYIDRKLVFYGTFSEFCNSNDMSKYFGDVSQHFICQRQH